jgi:PAS domain-containing protein
LEIIESLKRVLHAQEFKEQCRKKRTDFTRKRVLTFPVLVVFLMNLLTKTLQVELIRFLKLLSGQTQAVTVSKQAFSQARQKLSEQPFCRLSERLVDEFYTENTYTTWQGYRLIGVDGSTVQLPESDTIRQTFGCSVNQCGQGMPLGRVSVAYDLHNGLSIDARLAPYGRGERDLALEHLTAITAFDQRTTGRRGHAGDLFLFDMGYPALDFITEFVLAGKAVVIRTPDSRIKEVHAAIHAASDDQVIQIPLRTARRRMSPKLLARHPNLDPAWTLTLRVLTITLDDGRPEYLLTTLLDQEAFPTSVFHELYGKRWGSETHYDVVKNVLEMENFTGESVLAVRQDFYATVLTSNIQGVIQWELQEELEAENRSAARKYQYRLNTNVSIGLLKDTLVTLLMDQGDLQEFYDAMKRQMKRYRVPIRPGRREPRTRKTRRKYPMNKRRAL